MVVLPDGPPAVTSNPVSVTVKEGEAVTFSASSSGGPRPEVEWEVSSGGGSGWSPVPGATTSTLMLTNVTTRPERPAVPRRVHQPRRASRNDACHAHGRTVGAVRPYA